MLLSFCCRYCLGADGLTDSALLSVEFKCDSRTNQRAKEKQMTALESSIESLTAEYTELTGKLEQIDQQYRVERPVIVGQLSQLARALSALTGKPVAGPSGSVGRKPMSEEGKAAIKAGLERARASKQSGVAVAGSSAPTQKTAESLPSPPKPVTASAPVTSQTAGANTPLKKDVGSEKGPVSR
jgi:hypothetical protein